ncbi:dihydrofolate reductase [Pseudoduganella violaceinigra]|uniref:dihydrofolate reductase n=1 Tax=Pseudoduganella violaceinigra TaxID=246602 RepID=UPI0012B5A2F8|nr:dihydrofolate reductase [Pseudoduganella violaceinigra]
MTNLTIIVATDANNGIGIHNTLPWHLPEDLAHFKRLTSGHPIIMGRKTFDSIGRPLPNRRNIVISRNAEWRHEGVERAASLQQALDLVEGAGQAFVIGGGQIFEQAMPLVGKLVITRIGRSFECDAFFPALAAGEWQEVAREEHISAAGLPYAFISYHRN